MTTALCLCLPPLLSILPTVKPDTIFPYGGIGKGKETQNLKVFDVPTVEEQIQ
jgi:hypothetical protein